MTNNLVLILDSDLDFNLRESINGNSSAIDFIHNIINMDKKVVSEQISSKLFSFYNNEESPFGLYFLGMCYYAGIGTKSDWSLAFHYAKLSADKNCYLGQNFVGACYQMGYGCEKNYATALEYFKAAAEKGYHLAFHNISTMYSNGDIPKDLRLSLKFRLDAYFHSSPDDQPDIRKELNSLLKNVKAKEYAIDELINNKHTITNLENKIATLENKISQLETNIASFVVEI